MKTKVTQVRQRLLIAVGTALLGFGFVITPYVQALTLQDQISQLNAQNNESSQNIDRLDVQAESYQEEINRLQSQIDGVRAQLRENESKRDELLKQIKLAEEELEKQKKLLGENIKAVYVQGDISTLEMLASSKDLSEFLDKQQYRTAVQEKIKDTLDEINALKAKLRAQKELVDKLIADQQLLNQKLSTDQSEQSNLLAYTENQKVSYSAKIKQNNSKISELRRLQAIENAKLFGGTLGTGPTCGGGYPGSAPGPWGVWGCNYPLDYSVDTWGMYNRECVSYTAYKVAASGRHMPYWGGRGNANQWDNNAINSGIPVDRNPRVGDVAVSNAGYYGHVMYVEHVYEDGRILISQYNGSWTGTYSEAVIYPGSLLFIHFP